MKTIYILMCLTLAITATPTISSASHLDNTLYARYLCRSRMDGFKTIVPGSCSQYYECHNGRTQLHTCEYFYDFAKGECVTTDPGCVEITRTTPSCSGHCCGISNGYAVNPNNQQIYYQCTDNSVVSTHQCDGDQEFNVIEWKCDIPGSCSKCSGSATTVKPPCTTTTTCVPPTTTPCSSSTTTCVTPVTTPCSSTFTTCTTNTITTTPSTTTTSCATSTESSSTSCSTTTPCSTSSTTTTKSPTTTSCTTTKGSTGSTHSTTTTSSATITSSTTTSSTDATSSITTTSSTTTLGSTTPCITSTTSCTTTTCSTTPGTTTTCSTIPGTITETTTATTSRPGTTTTTCITSSSSTSCSSTTTTTCVTTPSSTTPCTTSSTECSTISTPCPSDDPSNSAPITGIIKPPQTLQTNIDLYVRYVCRDKPNDFMLASLKSCNQFYVCKNGVAIPISCGHKYFNALKGICDLPENTGCMQPPSYRN